MSERGYAEAGEGSFLLNAGERFVPFWYRLRF